MTKRKVTWIFLLMFVFSLGFLSAQEENPDNNDEGTNPAIESDWSVFDVPSYESGDQMFGLGFGLIFPVLFTDDNGDKIENKVNLGGTLFINYDYFFHPNMAAGMEVNFSFSSTIRENMLFQVPFGLRFTYQLAFHPIEIPITMAIGLAPRQYQDENYMGLYLKPSIGAFWRFSADWSFGLHGAWWWMPEVPKDKSKTVYGNFATLTLSARYHF
jgi:hypothetical protein